MKILILNGSPRQGNCAAAIKAFVSGIGRQHQVEVLNTTDLNIAACKACDACKSRMGCIDTDDTNAVVGKVVDADMLVFVSPVYWWGVSAQLKLVIDKCYSRGSELKNKKAAVIIAGGSPVDAEQYQLIRRQFDCICEYLDWKKLFHLDYYAYEKDELAGRPEALAELKAEGANLG